MTAEAINYVANQCILLFTAGRPTIEGIDEREVEAWVAAALSNVGTQEYYDNYRNFNQHTVSGLWIVPFSLNLTTDANFPEGKVAILTESPIALPKTRGFVSCRFTGGDIEKIDYEYWRGLQGGSLLTFSGGYFYSPMAGKAVILPACKGKTIPFSSVVLNLAVPNDATLTESQVILTYQRIEPMMRTRYGLMPDTLTDDYPTTK